jgi:ketosteroid isomerase-like protein
MQDDRIASIALLEQQRCQALVEGDLEALDRLVSDDLVHVHTTGRHEDKAGYLRGVAERIKYLVVTRESLTVRPLPNVAIATGVVTQTIRVRDASEDLHMRIFVTQIWSNAAGRWRQCTFQATSIV